MLSSTASSDEQQQHSAGEAATDFSICAKLAACNNNSNGGGMSSNRRRDLDLDLDIIEEPTTLSHPLLEEFANGTFSDISIMGIGRTWKLHKILLVQSPFLKKTIIEDKADIILLDFTNWPQVSREGLDNAFREMYICGGFGVGRSLGIKRAFIDKDNVFETLVAACYLELSDLGSYCRKFIEELLTCDYQNAGAFTTRIDLMIMPNLSGSAELQQSRLLRKYHNHLYKCCLGVLMYTLNLCPFFPSSEAKAIFPSAPEYLAQLPLKWIKDILCHEALAVSSEFDRYTLAKAVFKIRSTRSNVMLSNSGSPLPEDENSGESDEEGNSNVKLNTPSTQKKKSNAGKESISSSIYTFLDKVLLSASSSKKRKLDQGDDETQEENQETEDGIFSSPVGTRLIKTFPKVKPSEAASASRTSSLLGKMVQATPLLPDTLANIYQNGIVYTYMTFPQLGTVKSDGIVPFQFVLESHWLQAELESTEASNGVAGNISRLSASSLSALPPFRFAVKFEGVTAFFQNTANPRVLPSACFSCLGVQYRLLLSAEPEADEVVDDPESGVVGKEKKGNHHQAPVMILKALLQKSKGKGPKLNYSIYCFDHRSGSGRPPNDLANLLTPITACNNEGDGYANSIPLSYVKDEPVEEEQEEVVVVKVKEVVAKRDEPTPGVYSASSQHGGKLPLQATSTTSAAIEEEETTMKGSSITARKHSKKNLDVIWLSISMSFR